MDSEKLKERLSELIKSRDELVREANQQVAFLNGCIAEIETLIAELTEEKANDEKDA